MLTGARKPVSNRATFTDTVEVIDDDNGDLIDLSDVDEITLEVRRQRCTQADLSATLTGGEIEVLDTGIFQFTFTRDQMARLCPDTYDVGVTIKFDDDLTQQVLIGTVAVLDGVVQR